MVLLSYFRNHFKPEIYGHGYRGLFKQGLLETPAAMIAGILYPLIIGVSTAYQYYKLSKTGNDKKRYMYRYNIFRPDDEKLDWMILPPKLDAELKEIRSKMATT